MIFFGFLNPSRFDSLFCSPTPSIDDIIRQANAEAQAIVDKAVADAALEKKKAINDAKDEISGISLAIAEKVVERSLAAADQQKLIDDFLNNLGDVL